MANPYLCSKTPHPSPIHPPKAEIQSRDLLRDTALSKCILLCGLHRSDTPTRTLQNIKIPQAPSIQVGPDEKHPGQLGKFEGVPQIAMGGVRCSLFVVGVPAGPQCVFHKGSAFLLTSCP